jgi:multiple sugar transport system permease protein
LQQVFVYLALILVTLFFLLPLLWILRTSLITKLEAYKIPPNWNAPLTLENYVNIFRNNPFGKYFFNSFGISLLSTIASIILGAMAAYWIARNPGGSPRLRISILATQMIPPVVMVIPLSLIIKGLGLDDTWFAVIMAYLSFNLPYVVWMLISFFESVPKELDEAFEIDGCSMFEGYFRVVMPLAAPGLVATGVYSFIVSWNEFMFALNLTGLRSRTVPVAIANLETQQGVMIAELCASTIVAILPVVVLATVIKKFLVDGLTFGSFR